MSVANRARLKPLYRAELCIYLAELDTAVFHSFNETYLSLTRQYSILRTGTLHLYNRHALPMINTLLHALFLHYACIIFTQPTLLDLLYYYPWSRVILS